MEIVWDEDKRNSNLTKHGIDFVDAVHVLYDEYALTIEDNDHYEDRYIVIGEDSKQLILLVCYSYPDEDIIRIISARKADKKQVKHYEKSRFQ
jgi:uncharacterized protein